MAQSVEKYLARQDAEKKARAKYSPPAEYLGDDPDLYEFVRDAVTAHPELGKDYTVLYFGQPDEDNMVRIHVQNFNILRDDIRIDVSKFVAARKAELKKKAAEAAKQQQQQPQS